MPTNVDGFVIFGGIEEKWLSVGGVSGKLGHPVSNETPTFDGIGRFQNFQGGIVSWNPRPEMGAHVVWGLIGERWLQIGREQFGYPLTDETPTADGRGFFNHFRAFRPDGSLIGESSIFYLPEIGAHEIYGAIRDKWAQMDWDRSPAGYPTSAERDRSDAPGREQQFQHGRIVWSSDSGAVYDPVAIRPVVHLSEVADQGRFIEIIGTGFTREQTVKLGYGITSGGGPTTSQTGEDTLTSDGAGSFLHRIQINLGGDVSAGALATDVASGETATDELKGRRLR